jgi:hypothetical protein
MFKPSELKVTGKQRTIPEHEQLVIKNLKSHRNKLAAGVCMDILESGSGDVLNINGLKSTDINDIKNYFAEVAAPILILKQKMLPIDKMTKVFFSDSDTERLYDFKLFHRSEEILISNKQLKGGTNTLKPGDVVRLVDEDEYLKKKWQKTKYYKVFKILDESNVISGPIRAVMEEYPNLLRVKRNEYAPLVEKMSEQNETNIPPKEVPTSIMDLVKSDPVAFNHYKEKGYAAGTMLNFLFEKVLVDESKKDSKYNELFVEATSGNVLFFKFDISNRGILQYKIEDPKTAAKKAILRSKQGVERRSSSTGRLKLDKLGFQP